MDSPGLINRHNGSRWIPLLAIIQDDLRQSLRHWTLLIWALFAIGLPALWVFNLSNTSSASSHSLASVFDQPRPDRYVAAKPMQDRENLRPWEEDPRAQREAAEIAMRERGLQSSTSNYVSAVLGIPTTAQLGGKLLGLHLLLWSGLAIALGAAAISTEITTVGDSTLCWGVARWQYIVGKMISRAAVVGGFVVVLTLPTLWIFSTRTTPDVVWYAALRTVVTVALVLMAVTVAGVAVGSCFRSSIRAVGFSAAGLLAIGILATFFGSPDYSPLVFASQLTAALSGSEIGLPTGMPTAAIVLAGLLASAATVKFLWVDL